MFQNANIMRLSNNRWDLNPHLLGINLPKRSTN